MNLRKTNEASTFAICGRKYSVVITDDDSILNDNPDAYGFTDHANLRIVVRKSVSPRVQQETILHEIIHAVLDSSGAVKAIELVARSDVDEVLISALVPHLLQWVNVDHILHTEPARDPTTQ